jgi:hypothetical protein
MKHKIAVVVSPLSSISALNRSALLRMDMSIFKVFIRSKLGSKKFYASQINAKTR